jgi:hypothetical protein
MGGELKEVNWREIGYEILERVCESLDYYCHRVSGDSLEDCYSAFYDLPLYEVAELLEGLGFEGVRKRDIELLKEMPEEVYREIETELNRRIEVVLDNLRYWEE